MLDNNTPLWQLTIGQFVELTNSNKSNEDNSTPAPKVELPKYVNMHGAMYITSKSANALRVQISLGNLKAIKKGSRNYFEREYLENWIAGKVGKEA